MTVLLVAAPAFALPSPTADPSGPGGINPVPGNSGGEALNTMGDDEFAGGTDPLGEENCVGGLATGVALSDATVYGAPPGYHVMEPPRNATPGEQVQAYQDLVC